MKRLHARIDGNHTAIVKALRQVGCSVLSLAAVGKGCPDLLIARNGNMWLIEVKDGTKPPSARKLTEDQALFIFNWRAPVYIVKNIDEALNVVRQGMLIPNL